MEQVEKDLEESKKEVKLEEGEEESKKIEL